jgi:hypothetical protein
MAGAVSKSGKPLNICHVAYEESTECLLNGYWIKE